MDIIWTVLESLHFESTAFFCQIGLFFFMHFSLNYLVYQPIVEIRARRDARIASNLAAADAAASAARKLKEEYEERVRAARSEGQAALAQATAAAEADRKARVDQAREQADKMLAEAKVEAAAARERAEATVASQSEQVARAIASRLVASSLSEIEAGPVLARIGGQA